MITIRIRWRVVFQPICRFGPGHDWQEYAVIHAAWNWPGKWCRRCHCSMVRHTKWGWDEQGPDGPRLRPTHVREHADPWVKVEVR